EGHYVWLESRSRIAAATGEGEPYEVITTIRDISRRKAVEEDLAKSERDLRAVADHLPALISFADAEGVLQFCNATHAEWLGRDSAELLGHHLSEVLGSQAYDRQHQYLARALTGEAVEFELTLMHCDHPRDTRVSYVPRYSSAGVITGIYALITDITAAKAVERELDRLARFDALTSLPNRYQFDERLSEALARARRSKKPIALLFVDLDHFKTVNDTYGHPVGDEVLQEVARRLRSSLRATDVVARLAGDEFVVILESADAEQEPQFVARKILRAFEKPIDTAAGSIRVTMSIGLTQLRGDEASADALREADVALYRAKAAGRNGFRASS
ncbi:MAG TPA: GGDEF domain-containing protein, partial [Rudaea sp.]